MPNMNDLLRQAQVMQNKVLKLQQEMAEKNRGNLRRRRHGQGRDERPPGTQGHCH